MDNEPGNGDGVRDGLSDTSGYKVTWIKNKQGTRRRALRKAGQPVVWRSAGRRVRFVPGRGGR